MQSCHFLCIGDWLLKAERVLLRADVVLAPLAATV